jgi:high-affinity iron transporter
MLATLPRLLVLVVCALFALLSPTAAPAQAENPSSSVQTTWRLLDYIAVDYAGAVANGRIVSQSEYAEMGEFARTARTNIQALPGNSSKQRLLAQAGALEAAIASKASPQRVNSSARALATGLLAAYPVPLSPSSPPDLNRGRVLFSSECAACHGATGAGNGPMASSLNPRPIAFTDRARADQRSIFALYQVISQGIDGTGMQSFAGLPEKDRWSLALVAGNFAFTEEQRQAGERLWRQNEEIRQLVPNLEALVRLTPAVLAERIGRDRAELVTAYLRGTPSAVTSSAGPSLDVARTRLEESIKAYSAGDRSAAKRLALSAYLDGFEPVEGLLSARDAALMARIEGAMAELRSMIDRGQPAPAVAQQGAVIDELFAQAEDRLSPDQVSDASNFAGAFTILLREGLEALLIVVAMIAFLQKAERRDVLRYVHGGWVAALLAGLATWWVATSLIAVSGASRELMEGFGSLFAAVVLLSVGIWMHGKSNAQAWQRYIREKLDRALSKESAWFLFLLAFVVVYREVFETILFYATMWGQGGGGALLAGALTGAGVLALIAWAMLRYSRRLPITQFFSLSSILIAILAVVLAGKGVAGLQEAGLLSITPFAGAPRSDLLGLYPTVQTLLAQALAAAVLIIGFLANRRAALATS